MTVQVWIYGGFITDHWSGSMHWPVDWEDLPIEFEGARGRRAWIWNHPRADELCRDLETLSGGHIGMETWIGNPDTRGILLTIKAIPSASADDPGPFEALGLKD